MKKFLFFLILLAIFVLAAQRFELLNYFYSKPNKPLTEKQVPISPSARISPKVKPLIGIYYRMIDKQTAAQNKLVEGAYITQIIKGSPAEKADLREEDIIFQLDDKKISGGELQIVTKLIAEKKPGDTVNLKIWRNKKLIDIPVTLGLDK